MKAYNVNIQYFKLGDSTNGGVSSKRNDFILLEDYSKDEIEKFIAELSLESEQILLLEKRVLWGENHWFVSPYVKKEGCSQMFGGNKVWSDDPKFPSEFPLKLHDRFETSKEYAIYSA